MLCPRITLFETKQQKMKDDLTKVNSDTVSKLQVRQDKNILLVK